MAIWILVFLETNRRSWILDIGKFCEKKKPKSVYYLWWKKEKCRKLWIVLFWAFLFLETMWKEKTKKNIFLFENLKNNTEDHFVALLERMLNFLSVKAFFPFFFCYSEQSSLFLLCFQQKEVKKQKKRFKKHKF